MAEWHLNLLKRCAFVCSWRDNIIHYMTPMKYGNSNEFWRQWHLSRRLDVLILLGLEVPYSRLPTKFWCGRSVKPQLSHKAVESHCTAVSYNTKFPDSTCLGTADISLWKGNNDKLWEMKHMQNGKYQKECNKNFFEYDVWVWTL